MKIALSWIQRMALFGLLAAGSLAAPRIGAVCVEPTSCEALEYMVYAVNVYNDDNWGLPNENFAEFVIKNES